MNIFIFSEDPKATFEFVPLYPAGLDYFSVI
jgi:hypothetical protein